MTENQDFTQSSGVNNGKSNTFYNTIGATGQQLRKFKRQAESQETKVLTFLKSYPNDSFTKHEIKINLVKLGRIHERTPESSINRALSNLMNDGKVIKLGKKRIGEFDKPNHLWTVNI